MKPYDIAGNIFGRVEAIEVVGFTREGKRQELWKCRCRCGNEFVVKKYLLLYGKVKSCGCLTRLSSGEAAENQAYSMYKHGAKKRGIEFNLSKKDFLYIVSLNCHYCDAPPSNVRKATPRRSMNGSLVYSGIDRIDNSKGYVLGNVVPCCKICNFAKKTLSYADFKDWIFRVSSNMLSRELFGKDVNIENQIENERIISDAVN